MAEFWDVIYRASADFGPVIRAAAQAKAALDAMSKSANAANAEQLNAEQKLAAARQAEIDKLKAEAAQVRTTADSYKAYNVQALYGGRSDMQSHLSDMDRELQYETLLNRARWMGFSTPQQAYAWRQNEYNQLLLMNRAQWAGYASADQYLQYLQKQTALFTSQNAQLLAQADAYRQNADAATAYYSAVSTSHKTAGQLGGDNLNQVNALNDAISGLPDQVTTQVNVDTSQAMTAIAAYKAELASIPQTETSTLVTKGTAPVVPGSSTTDTVAFNDDQAKADLAAWTAELQHVPPRVEVTADFDDAAAMAKAQSFYAFIDKHRNAGAAETLTALTASGNAGGGGGPPPAATAAAAAGGGDANNAAAEAAALKNLSLALADEKLKADAAAASQVNLGKAMADTVEPAAAAKQALKDAASAADDSGSSARRAYGYWGMLSKEITLWAGLLGDTHMIGQVQAWHILLDGIVETLALWVPALSAAAIGLGAWGIAGYQAGKQIYDQMLNVHEVSTALNQAVPPLTGNFSKLADAVRPQVYELFGDALTVMNDKGSTFSTIAEETGKFLDQLGAKITGMLTSGGNGLISFFDVGVKDLALLGKGFADVAVIADKFLQATALTHVAEDLATVVDGILNLVAAIVKVTPAPVLAVLLGLHGLVLWGGLAFDAVAKVTVGLAGMLAKIGPLNDAMLTLASRLGASTDKLTKMAQSAPAVQAVAGALNTSSKEAAGFQVQASKLGASMDDLALGTQKGRDLFDQYGASLDENGQKAVKLAIATQGTEDAVAAVASKFGVAGKAAEDEGAAVAESAAQHTGLISKLGGLAASLPLVGGLFGKTSGEVAATGEAAAETAVKSDSLLSKVGSLATKVPLLGGAFAALASIPVAGWIAAGAAALAGLGYWLSTLPDTTQKWINSVNQSVSTAGIYKVIGATVSALAADTIELNKAQKDGLGNLPELAGEHAQLSGQLQAELTHTAAISKAYGVDMPTALALMNAAGVTTTQLFTTQSKVWDQAAQQVKGLVTGYQAMGQQLGAIGGDLNALLVSESSQVKQMGNVNSAWDAWTKTIAGAPSALITLAQGFQQFATDAKAAGASMTGLNGPSLQLQSDFQANYSNVEQLFDAFRNTQALTGKGNFTQFVKDAVAALIPMAGNSKEAAAQISSLAQEAGGPATTNIKTLQQWVGNIKHPLQDMQKASNDAATAASNLSQDAARLSNTLQSDVNPAMAQAIFTADGGQAVFNNMAEAFKKYGATAPQTVSASRQVAQELLAIDGNTASAKSQFVAFATQMGMTKGQADNLWNSLTTGKSAVSATSQASDNLRQSLDKTQTSAQNLGKPGLWGQIENLTINGFTQLGHSLEAAYDGINNWFANSVPHGFSVAWNAAANWFTNSVPHAIETAWDAVSNWFTQSIPHAWSVAWNASVNWFNSNVIAPLSHFFTSTIPGWWDDLVGWAKHAWSTVWSDFNSSVLSPLSHFFTSTIPGWWSDFTSWASRTWKTIWSDFNSDVLSPFTHFFTSTIPGWWDSLGTKARNTWKTVWKDFNSDVISPMTHWFTSTLPGAMENAFKGGVNWVVNNVINKGIDLINKVVGIIPGVPHIGHVPTLATGGSIPGPADSDNITIRAMGGEYMLRQPARMAIEKDWGRGFLDRLNHYDTLAGSGSRGTMASQQPYAYASGGQIAADAQKYVGHRYVYGGPSNPTNGWDCSSFASYVLGHDEGMGIPGGSWAAVTNSGASHGPTAAAYQTWSGAKTKADQDPQHAQAGDLLTWNTHTGFARGPNQMVSAYDTAMGTADTSIIGAGPGGEPLVIRQITGAGGGGGFLGFLENLGSSVVNSLSSFGKGVLNMVGGTASDLLKLAAKGSDAVFDFAWSKAIQPVISTVTGHAGVPGQMAAAGLGDAKTGIDKWLKGWDAQEAAANVAPAGVPATSGTVANWITTALKDTGEPLSWLPLLETLVSKESGGNPNAVNPTAVMGEHASGLFQTLPSTYSAFATVPGGVFNPVSDAVAGIRYIMSQYGSPANIPGLVSGTYRGYATGGPVKYTVKSGDNLTEIASKYHDTWQQLYAANKTVIGSNPNLIYPGEVLTIPGTAPVTPPKTTAGPGGDTSVTITPAASQNASGFVTIGTSGPGPSGDSQAWGLDAAAMLKDWVSFRGAWNVLFGEKAHRPKGVTQADWNAWGADMNIAEKSYLQLAKLMGQINDPWLATPATFTEMTGPTGTPLLAEILRGVIPAKSLQFGSAVAPNPKVGLKYFPTQMSTAFNRFDTFSKALRVAQAAQTAMAADVSSAQTASAPSAITPGAISAPAPIAAAPVNLSGYATMGAPSTGVSGTGGTLGFASGGTVSLDQVAGMFGAGGMVSTTGLPLTLTSRSGRQLTLDQVTAALAKSNSDGPARTLSAAANSSRIGAQITGDIHVHNPVAEQPSTSITKAVGRLSFLGARGV